jgi:hypothetical protein
VTGLERHGVDHRVRLTMADELGGDIDGAWWPYTPAMARELPELVEVVQKRLGKIIDIAVNWSTLDGTPDLNPLTARAPALLPGQRIRHQRVITVVGETARAQLLVVPAGTSRPIALMVLRQAAALPIHYGHRDTAACRTAAQIVHIARTESAQRAAADVGRVPAAAPVLLD